jgi:hypothetical protein
MQLGFSGTQTVVDRRQQVVFHFFPNISVLA